MVLPLVFFADLVRGWMEQAKGADTRRDRLVRPIPGDYFRPVGSASGHRLRAETELICGYQV